MLNHSNIFSAFNSYDFKNRMKKKPRHVHKHPDDAVAAAANDDDDASVNGMVAMMMIMMITTTIIIITTPRSSWWSMMIMRITTIMINDHQFVSVIINLSIIVLSSLL